MRDRGVRTFSSEEVTVALVIASALAAFIAASVMKRVLGALDRRKRRVRAQVAGRAERDAEELLGRGGYRVLDRQAARTMRFEVDGQAREVTLRADLLVEREGRSFVAEVKSGSLAPRIDHAPTRRQLLEYTLGYEVDGVLLVDMQKQRISEVVLAGGAQRGEASGRGSFVAAKVLLVFALGVAFGVLATR